MTGLGSDFNLRFQYNTAAVSMRLLVFYLLLAYKFSLICQSLKPLHDILQLHISNIYDIYMMSLNGAC